VFRKPRKQDARVPKADPFFTLRLAVRRVMIASAATTRQSAMKEKRHIEREFGVPIAGEILDKSLWSQTALKKLPVEGKLDWEKIFGRKAPLVVDIGCGNGRFLIGSAVWRL